MRIHIDALQCEGHGMCAAAAPDLYDLNDDGYANSTDFDVPPESEEQADSGALACPMGAIKVLH
ncbi:ferredoxin [Rhodococcus artemisiae]|uniref:Ferredoxin n=1 Tax=Rhodococcus artemisiae TaxID=714159 RepID=A0ABU7LCA3_9NOCA|nr:ferredoxin [Rhodococcus artemisiae]MEE2059181.1 ferredoxin [Rhodococcus artemisiae]